MQPTNLARTLGTLLVVGALSLSTAGCKSMEWVPFWPSTVPDPLLEGEEGGPVRIESSRERGDSGGALPANALDEATGRLPERAPDGGDLPEGRQLPELPMVHFEVDKSELSAAASAILAGHAEYLLPRKNLHVILRGHTDDTGTAEYNLALGARRAQAVRERLVALGVEADRVRTVSFGQAAPLDPGTSADARARNRRVEFFVFEKP